ATLAALERAWRGAHAAQVQLRTVGFRRVRWTETPIGRPAPACDRALVDLIRQRILLASVRAGVHAIEPGERPSEPKPLAAPRQLRTLALELAARSCPFVDVPACLGGVQTRRPDASTERLTEFTKSDACCTCPLDARCPGASEQLAGGD